MIRACLDTLERGDADELFEIIPRIGVLRDPRFTEPLLAMLLEGDAKRREFAAYAMGAMGNREFLKPLEEAFERSQKEAEPSADVELAILESIGAIGDDVAVGFFVSILERASRSEARGELRRQVIESLGAIAQQGGQRSLTGLLELTGHEDSDVRAQAIEELSVAYWHRPNEIPEATLQRIYELCSDADDEVAESALSALESLADVGCRKAERLVSLVARE